ncbi:hypothetical protein [Candidatus Avelusimicrobium fimicolum]|uniref:hypothetical protein n=1 Tax=Candidatus Avelusimicrobium fimicolum TaxID=3416216 RepID=UPI0015AEDE6D
MKKILIVLACAAALGACASSGAGINATPAKLTKAVAAADRTCQTDADCVAVQKGCCPCAGFEAVNKTAAAKVQNVLEKACANAGCTREACYTRITTACVNNVCTGKLIAPKAVAF